MSQNKKLGLGAAVALSLGNMIGSGIFLLPAALAPFGGISLFGWGVTTAGSLCLALVFARLSQRMPRTGGPYAYTHAGFGAFPGFLVGWGYWVSIWCGNAAIAVAFSGYAADFLPGFKGNNLACALLALSAVWTLTIVNWRGIRWAGNVQTVTTLLKLVPLVMVGALGIFALNPEHLAWGEPAAGQGFFGSVQASAALTLWAFMGLESATIPAGNIEQPEKNIPRATVIATLGAAVVYILATTAVQGIIPPEELASSTAPFAQAAHKLWGPWGGHLVGLGALIACFGALNGWTLLQGQLPYAIAQNDIFPARLAHLSRYGTPTLGLFLSSILVSIILLTNYTKGMVHTFTFLILLSTLTCLVPYIFSSLAEFTIGKGNRPKGWQAITAIAAFVYTLWAMAGCGMESVYWGFLLLMTGIPVFVFMRRTPSK